MSGDARSGRREGPKSGSDGVPGIVITVGKRSGPDANTRPNIRAFVWGARARPTPTLPYGRWKAPA